MTPVEFKGRKVNKKKLLSFGFEATDRGYAYQTELAQGQMKLTVLLDPDDVLYAEVTDKSSGEEYVLHRVAGAAGPFVGQVRNDYEAVLEKISAQCFDTDVFKSDQAKAIIGFVKDTYGDELEFLWEKFPDNAIWRRKDNKKWYGALLTVKARKLGLDNDEQIEILDLRIKTEDIKVTVDNKSFFGGYHMNKKHWYTLLLDGSIPTEEICSRIGESYLLAKK